MPAPPCPAAASKPRAPGGPHPGLAWRVCGTGVRHTGRLLALRAPHPPAVSGGQARVKPVGRRPVATNTSGLWPVLLGRAELRRDQPASHGGPAPAADSPEDSADSELLGPKGRRLQMWTAPPSLAAAHGCGGWKELATCSCSVPTPGPGHTPRASGPRAAAQLLRVLCADAVAARPQAGWEKPGHASSHSGVFGSSDVPADTGRTGAGQACSATGPRRALVGVRVRPPPAPAGTAGPMLCVWCVLKVAQAGKCKAAVLDFRPRSGRRSPGPPHARARPHIGRAAPWLHPPPLRPLAPRLPLILPSLKTQPAELSQAPESSGLF